jgi:hypothetical protein
MPGQCIAGFEDMSAYYQVAPFCDFFLFHRTPRAG